MPRPVVYWLCTVVAAVVRTTNGRFLSGLTMTYGIVLAILGAAGSGALGVVALVGAFVIGGLWALRGMLEDRQGETPT